MRKSSMGKWKGRLLCLALLCLCLTGCIPNEFTQEEAEEQEKAAMEIFNRYLDEELGSGKIESAYVHTDSSPGTVGLYLTDFVDGRFTYQEETYSFAVNTRTEEIYTSLKLEELKEKGREYVLDFFDISCDEIVESDFYVGVFLPALEEDPENIYKGGDTGLTDVLPVTFEVSEQDMEEIFSDENYDVKIYITYKGEMGLSREGYGIEELPGLKRLELKHMKDKAEASEELGGIYDYMMSESLRESVQDGALTVRYAKWDHLEQDGFHLFFEGYCRENTDGEVKETLLEEDEDVELLVEGERIEVVCDEEIKFFLFAEELSGKEYETTVIWEYVMGSGHVGHAERAWLKDGDRYVLGGKGDRKPCVFSGREGGSVIYMGDMAKDMGR